jgi:hypothetical protein
MSQDLYLKINQVPMLSFWKYLSTKVGAFHSNNVQSSMQKNDQMVFKKIATFKYIIGELVNIEQILIMTWAPGDSRFLFPDFDADRCSTG